MSDSATHGLQQARLLCPPLSPGVCSNSCPLNEWFVISPSYPLPPHSPFAFNFSQHQGLFQWVSSLYQVAKVMELQLQHQSFHWIFRVNFLQDWLVWSPCSPSDYQESSLASQFESIDSSSLSLLYGPALTSLHNYWKNYSFEHRALSEKCLCFLIRCLCFQGATVF